MGLGERAFCQIRKSSAEKGFGVVHNADATKTEKNRRRTTSYVNICNLSTQDIVVNVQNATNI